MNADFLGGLTLPAVLELLNRFGLLTAAVLWVYAGVRRLWVFGYQLEQSRQDAADRLEDMTADRDAWRELALRGTGIADRLAIAAAMAAAKVEGKP